MMLVLSASYIARAHTCLALTAFTVALCLGLLLHYRKIVKNDVASYPQEWFPSVSATIGDWYPERNIFQILIALTSGPRLCLVAFQYYINRSNSSALSTIVLISGLVRTLSCGGWVYITSSDDHDIHDFFMITYMVFNLPWMLGGIFCTPQSHFDIKRKRQLVAGGFFGALVPLVYFFVQHKVYRVPGAYTRYSFFEWSLIFFDILFDSFTEEEFRKADLKFSLSSSIPVPTQATKPSEKVADVSPNPQASHRVSDSEAVTQVTWLESLKEWRTPIAFVSDAYLSYIFWSVFTSLIPTLFYFSVWKLGIAGHELALLSTFSPLFLAIPGLLPWIRTRGGQTTLYLLSFAGLLAYALPKPMHRLIVVAFATSAGVLCRVVQWSGPDVGYQATLMALGLLLSSLSKHANHSNNPVWPLLNEHSGGYNKTGIFLALLAVYESFTRSEDQKSRSDKSKSIRTESYHWLQAGIPLGALLFVLHALLSDSSTLVSWSWRGYQNGRPRGPLPHIHSSLTLISQCLGILLSLSPSVNAHLSSPYWFLYGATSSFVLYRYRDWPGYIGGLNLACFAMSIIPFLLHRAAQTESVTKTYVTTIAFWCLLIMANVWTVAYAFVPGGVYLRERTDLVLMGAFASLALAFRVPKTYSSRTEMGPSIKSYAKTLMAITCTLSVLVTLYRLPVSFPQPFKPGQRLFRASIWTLHFGIDNEGRDSQRRVMDVIRDMELDIIGLLETDLNRVVFGNRDLTRIAVEQMGYYVDIGPGPNSHTWGAALLSKFPIINSTHHLLPSPHGELAPAIEAVLDIYGTPVTVVVAHNGQEEDPLDRELQSTELARIMSASPYPVVFLGYVVTTPRAKRPAPYQILVEDGRMHDIDEEDSDRWCEYILYRGLYRTAYARVSRGTITDTELQIGQFALARHGFEVKNDSREARYLRSFKEHLPEAHWFPLEYYNNWGDHHGVNGHFYHVFNTPLYYRIPEDAVL